MYYSANTAANVVSGNFIYNLSVNPASTTASIYGIKILSGTATYYNNIINLGGNTPTTIYGIYDTGAGSQNCNSYFNTVNIGGTLASGVTNKSYAFYSNTNGNSRNLRNNIFNNSRSTISGSNLHYATYFNYATSANLTLDYNDYYVSGIGGMYAFYNSANISTLAALQSNLGQNLASTFSSPSFTNAGGTNTSDYVPTYNRLVGITGTGVTTDFSGTTRASSPTMGAFEVSLLLSVEVWKSGVLQAQYPTLKNAFDKINDGTHTGALELRLTNFTEETTSAVLYQSGYTGSGGTSNYTSVNIYPTVSGISISGNLATPLIDLYGADNVTLDGRVNATGSTKDLNIINLSNSGTAGTSTIRFINDATNNTVKYCNIKGSETVATSGVVFFSTAGITGNDNNTIDNNAITTSTDLNRPLNAVYSSGTPLFENSNITISNNNIYNFLNRFTASYGINLAANTTACSVTGNSLYETASFIPSVSVAYTGIYINNTSGNGFDISGNYIGGQSTACGGSALTKTNAFNSTFMAINLNVGITTASNIQNNTIKNFSWSNSSSATWTGINVVTGLVNIGTTIGNTIGATSGTGSINITSGVTGNIVYGICLAGGGFMDCENNTIGSINTYNAATDASIIYGINRTGSGIATINNNLIGSTSTTNSINATSTSTANAQSVYGIYNSTSSNLIANGNTIANLTNTTTNATTSTAGVINGITTTTAACTIQNNTIYNLTNANTNSSSINTASVCGLAITGNYVKTITGNVIYNLSNSNNSFTGTVIGIYFVGNTGSNYITGNFINNLSVSASTASANIIGIKMDVGKTLCNNNILNLGGNTSTTIYGLYDTGVAANPCSINFNTVYINGALGSGITNKSYCLYSNAAANVRDYRNNLFVNARSTVSGVNLHYATYLNYAVSTSLTLDFNDYYVTGTGGVLGFYNGANVSALPLITGFDTYSLYVDPSFASAGGTSAANYNVSSNKIAGYTISGLTTDYSGTNRKGTPTMGAFEGSLSLNVDVYIAGVLQSTYYSLKDAFDKINNGTHTGNIEVRVKANTTETASAVLYQSGYTGAGGTSSYSAINIYPTVSGLSISGNLASTLIDFNGADNVTFDGRVNATGSTKSLIINNTNTSTTSSTIHFYNTAENNTIKYCNIKGSETSLSTAIVYFSTASAGNGNSSNTFDNDNFTGNSTNRPYKVFYSSGSAGFENKSNTISNSNFYDFLNPNNSSYGIDIANASLNWTISGNSFYETTTFAPTGAYSYNAIRINTGDNNQAIGNYIGGSSPQCGGSPWTIKANTQHYFAWIYITGGSSIACIAQNNIITNIDDTSLQSNPFDGIYINSGNVNVTGNTIGATTGTGSIKVTTPVATATTTVSGGVITAVNVIGGGSGYTTAPLVTFSAGGSGAIATANLTSGVVTSITLSSGGTGYATAPTVILDGQTNAYSTSHGIRNFSTGIVNVTGNNVGSITTTGTTSYSHGIESIIFNGNAGTVNISNNLIGSLTTANSINTSSTAVSSLQKQDVYGIFSLSTGTATINNNTIANLKNGYTGTFNSSTKGVSTSSGSNTITNNTVYNISSISSAATVYGISQTNATAGTNQSITNNTVYNLSNTNATDKIDIYGIYNSCPTTGTNSMSNNFVHSISLTTTNSTSNIYAIYAASGASTLSNNIVNIGNGITTGYGLFGIYDASANTSNLYFNTVFIGGTASGSTSHTYAMMSSSNVSTRNYRNNVFYNSRTGGTTGKHYAIRLAGTAGLTINYNDYFIGTGGMLGYLGSDIATFPALQTVTGQDANSLNHNPYFTLAGSTTASNYQAGMELIGVTGTGITTDYSTAARNTPPSMGAWEIVINKWKGATNTDWNTASNWTKGTVLTDGSNLYFDPAPVNHCLLNANHPVNHIFNSQSTYRTVANGYKLTVNGSMVFANGAQIDASATNSTIEFAGSLAQNIPSGSFYNNNIYNLTINNANNVTLNGTLNLLNTFTATSGKLDAFTYSPSLSYSGSTSQSINSSQYLSDKMYNFIVDNSAGVTLNANLTINNTVTINSGKLLTIPPAKQLNVIGTITNNAGPSGLYIQSSSSAANGSLIFHNTYSSPVSATVEMYSKANWNLSDTIGSKYRWQYFGIPFRTMVADPNFNGGYVRKWNQYGTTTSNHWIQQGNDSTLTSFVGYEICQAAPKTYIFSGQLENRDFSSGQLAYTSSALYPGQHIFANPYTAAIDITKLSFGTQTEATVYFYNTGTFGQWIDIASGIWGNNPGQYLSVPKNLAGFLPGLPSQIPSMQAILIKAMSNSSLATYGISYSSVITANTEQQRIKQLTDSISNDKVYTLIDVKGIDTADRIWLFSQPNCSHKFDNGWDGEKLSGSAFCSQLFAMEKDGNYQVDAVDDMNNTDLGFQAGQDNEYKLTFTHINTLKQYAGILLLDMVENKTIDITPSGSTYTFNANSTTAPVKRFKIITLNSQESISGNTSQITIFYAAKTAFIKNLSNQDGQWILYDISGHVVSTSSFAANAITTLTETKSGVYILKAITSKEVVTQKIIIY
ncbi:MAG: T9SS type A sorting domain-containing protein [Paludibacter sp.]